MLSDSLLGHRIVLRYRRSDAGAQPAHSDLVGELTGLTADTVTVTGRRGPVTIARSAVRIVRPVAANRRDILELERITRLGWRAAHSVELDGWLMYADRGWTGRANSVLPLRTPARPLGSLLDAARDFYAGHGLPLQIQIPLPARGLLDAELAGRCWRIERAAIVLTRTATSHAAVAAAAVVAPPDSDSGYQVELAGRPAEDWLACYHYRGAALPHHAIELLTRHDTVRFGTVRLDGQVVAIARGALDQGWLGVTAVEVVPEHRRRGVAGLLMRRLTGWAAAQEAHNCYLQVDAGNSAALAFYAGLGFTEHHRYHYRLEPAG
ncbi:MAG: GNAT family N-acetyltransferase [Jatrophihabitans sp.]